MARILEFRHMAEVIRGIKGKVRRATARALMRTAVAATNQAKRNARDTFRGSRGRPKTGALLNAIFTGFEMASGQSRDIAEAFVAVRSRKGNRGTRPYGRIHEYGGEIRPRKARHLWIPLFGPKTRFPGGLAFHTMTPTDFVEAKGKRRRPGDPRFWIIPGRTGGKVAGVSIQVGKAPAKSSRRAKARLKMIPLFALKQEVQMPARPFVTPAVVQEQAKFKARLEEELQKAKRSKDGGPVPKKEG